MCRLLLAVVTASAIATLAAETGRPAGETSPRVPFLLYISNQSFDVPEARIAVTIDGKHVVDRIFRVENQHNWILHRLRLRKGRHTFRVVAENGRAVLTRRFSLPKRRWGVLDFWCCAPHLTLQISARRPLFG